MKNELILASRPAQPHARAMRAAAERLEQLLQQMGLSAMQGRFAVPQGARPEAA
jgi:hypothetical protein